MLLLASICTGLFPQLLEHLFHSALLQEALHAHVSAHVYLEGLRGQQQMAHRWLPAAANKRVRAGIGRLITHLPAERHLCLIDTFR